MVAGHTKKQPADTEGLTAHGSGRWGASWATWVGCCEQGWLRLMAPESMLLPGQPLMTRVTNRGLYRRWPVSCCQPGRLCPRRSNDHTCARTLVLPDCRPWIVNMRMLRGCWRDGQHLHPGLGFEAMPTPLGHDHQHAGRQLQGLQDILDDHVKAGGPLQNLHDLIPVRMPLPSTAPAKMRGENATVTIVGKPGKRFARLFIGRVPIALFEQGEACEIAV